MRKPEPVYPQSQNHRTQPSPFPAFHRGRHQQCIGPRTQKTFIALGAVTRMERKTQEEWRLLANPRRAAKAMTSLVEQKPEFKKKKKFFLNIIWFFQFGKSCMTFQFEEVRNCFFFICPKEECGGKKCFNRHLRNQDNRFAER